MNGGLQKLLQIRHNCTYSEVYIYSTYPVCKDVQHAVACAGTTSVFIPCHQFLTFSLESNVGCGDATIKWDCEE